MHRYHFSRGRPLCRGKKWSPRNELPQRGPKFSGPKFQILVTAEIFEESLITIESGGTEEDVAGDGGVFDGGFEEGAMKFTL